MKKQNIFFIALIIIVVLALSIHYNVIKLEMIPNSEQMFIVNPPSEGYMWVDYHYAYYAIAFIIPDTDRNVFSKFELYGTGNWGEGYSLFVGLSKILTIDKTKWITDVDTFKCKGGWVSVLENPTSKSTNGPIFFKPGETWYLIINRPLEPHSYDYFSYSTRTITSNDNQTMHLYLNGEFVEQSSSFIFRAYGYKDEVFYVDYTFSPEKPVINEPVVFTDASNQNLIAAHQWIINNTLVGTDSTLTWVFTEPKIYDVTLIGVSYEGSNLQMNRLIDVRIEWPDEPVETEIPWWLVLGLILSGLASVYIYYKKIKSKGRYIIYLVFSGFLIYFIYVFI